MLFHFFVHLFVRLIVVLLERYRYTEWVKFDFKNCKPMYAACNACPRMPTSFFLFYLFSSNIYSRDDEDGILARELYSHVNDDGSDFDMFENENVVDDSRLESIVESLHQTIKTQFG